MRWIELLAMFLVWNWVRYMMSVIDGGAPRMFALLVGLSASSLEMNHLTKALGYSEWISLSD